MGSAAGREPQHALERRGQGVGGGPGGDTDARALALDLDRVEERAKADHAKRELLRPGEALLEDELLDRGAALFRVADELDRGVDRLAAAACAERDSDARDAEHPGHDVLRAVLRAISRQLGTHLALQAIAERAREESRDEDGGRVPAVATRERGAHRDVRLRLARAGLLAVGGGQHRVEPGAATDDEEAAATVSEARARGLLRGRIFHDDEAADVLRLDLAAALAGEALGALGELGARDGDTCGHPELALVAFLGDRDRELLDAREGIEPARVGELPDAQCPRPEQRHVGLRGLCRRVLSEEHLVERRATELGEVHGGDEEGVARDRFEGIPGRPGRTRAAEDQERGYGTDDAEDDDASALRKSSDHGGSVSPDGRSSLLWP